MRMTESDWSVRVYNTETDETETVEVTAQTEDGARKAALEGVPDEWAVEVADRLCDFCKPAPHPRCEAYTEVSVVDESDIMDAPPGDFEAPKRAAWVCLEHYEVVQSLPTYRAAKEA